MAGAVSGSISGRFQLKSAYFACDDQRLSGNWRHVEEEEYDADNDGDGDDKRNDTGRREGFERVLGIGGDSDGEWKY